VGEGRKRNEAAAAGAEAHLEKGVAVPEEPGRHGVARLVVGDGSLLLRVEDLVLLLQPSDHLRGDTTVGMQECMSALKERQLIRSLPWGVKQPYPVDGRFEVLFVDCELVVAGRDEGGFVTHVGDVGSCRGGRGPE
jgi:hypothetical protein